MPTTAYAPFTSFVDFAELNQKYHLVKVEFFPVKVIHEQKH
jgi:hypothetical protein